MKKFNWRIFGTFFGAIAFVVSAYFTCDLLIGEASTDREKLVHFLWGIACQGFLAFFCTTMFVAGGPKRFIYGSLFLLALILSLQGTIAQRAMNRQSQLNSEITNDSEYSDLIADRKRLKKKIDKFDEKILKFIDDKMIKNGTVPTEKKLKEAKEELAEVEKRLANYSHKTGSEANAPFIAWARFCNEDASEEELAKIAENSHMWVTIGYAVLLDVGGPVAFGAVISPHVGNFMKRRRRRRAEEYENEDEIEEDQSDHVRTAASGPDNSYSSHSTSNSSIPPKEHKPQPAPKTEPEQEKEEVQLKIETLPDDTPLAELPRNRKGKIRAFNKTTLLEHIKNMFHIEGGPKDGHLKGQKRTAELYKAIHEVGTMAHKWLKAKDLITVKGKYSYANMSQSDMLNYVKKNYLH